MNPYKPTLILVKTLILFFTILLFLPLGHAYAYEFEWIGLQTREFASGRVFNRAYFAITPIDTYIDLAAISLTDPNDESVPYEGTSFTSWRRLLYYSTDGYYNLDTELFDYGPVTQHLYFSMDFDIDPPTSQPLIVGTYTFDIDGDLQTSDVNAVVDNLPFVDSETLKKSYGFNPDYSENVTTLYWSIPDFSGLDLNNIQFRASVEFFNGPTWVGGLYIDIPIDLNHVIIPDSVINNENFPEHTKISVGIQVEDIPYQHRTYSNFVNMEDINPMMVTLLAPNGGEIIPSGSVYTIEWEAAEEVKTFKLKYSMDNGATWEKDKIVLIF